MTKLNKQIAGYDVCVTEKGEFVVDVGPKRLRAASLPALKKKVEAWQQEQAAPEPPVVAIIYYYKSRSFATPPRRAWIVGHREEKNRKRGYVSNTHYFTVKYDSLDSAAREVTANRSYYFYSDELWEALSAGHAALVAADQVLENLCQEAPKADAEGYLGFARAALSPARADAEES